MRLSIPFYYQVTAVKKNERLPSNFICKDRFDLTISEVSGAHISLAMRHHSEKRYWSGRHFFKPSIDFVSQTMITSEQFYGANHNRDLTRAANTPTALHPFTGAWGVPALEADVLVLDKNNTAEVLSDTRDSVINKIQRIADRLLIIDGILCEQAQELVYTTIQTGHSYFNGSVSLIVRDYHPDLDNFFDASQKEDAISYATDIARQQGYTGSAPIEPKDHILLFNPVCVYSLRNPKTPIDMIVVYQDGTTGQRNMISTLVSATSQDQDEGKHYDMAVEACKRQMMNIKNAIAYERNEFLGLLGNIGHRVAALA